MSMPEAHRNIILGIGNTLNRDEGLGVHLLPLLHERIGARTGMEFLDGGTLGLNLLPLVEECHHLLLLDAVDAGKPGGTVIELARDRIPMFSGVRLSQHQLTFQEVLGLAQVRGKLPEFLHLIGVQPADMSIGFGMTGEVKRMVPVVLRRAESLLHSWGMITTDEEAEHVLGCSR
jgi:hydrogenase maturation protease